MRRRPHLRACVGVGYAAAREHPVQKNHIHRLEVVPPRSNMSLSSALVSSLRHIRIAFEDCAGSRLPCGLRRATPSSRCAGPVRYASSRLAPASHQRQQNALRVMQSAELVRGWPACFRIDQQLLDHACKPVQREVQVDGCVRPDAALNASSARYRARATAATFSIAGATDGDATRRARPVRFSVSTGLRLCGHGGQSPSALRENTPPPPELPYAAGGGSLSRCARWSTPPRPAPRRMPHAGRAG